MFSEEPAEKPAYNPLSFDNTYLVQRRPPPPRVPEYLDSQEERGGHGCGEEEDRQGEEDVAVAAPQQGGGEVGDEEGVVVAITAAAAVEAGGGAAAAGVVGKRFPLSFFQVLAHFKALFWVFKVCCTFSARDPKLLLYCTFVLIVVAEPVLSGVKSVPLPPLLFPWVPPPCFLRKSAAVVWTGIISRETKIRRQGRFSFSQDCVGVCMYVVLWTGRGKELC